ncbi:MAG: hypothetical protein KJ941_13315 [Bacteroidetes bacterium]|nr:hypothetical protein [Bacteroidota bacterium]
MIKEFKNKGDQYWFFSMLGFPFFFMMASSENYSSFAEEPVLKIVIGLLLGFIGLGIGFILFRLFKNKSSVIKWSVFGALLVCCIVYARVMTNFQSNKLPTCVICGYHAVDKKTSECFVCGSETWLETKSYDDRTYETWIKEEQLFWFDLDPKNGKPNFFEPKNLEGYFKDESWSPSITEKELLNFKE